MNQGMLVLTRTSTVCCQIAGHKVLRASAEEITSLRRQPIVVGDEKLSVSFLKHADDQTVLGLTSVLKTIQENGWGSTSFENWGAIAGPNLFGRTSIAHALHRFREEGAWGVSPQLIPQISLHALSGTISQALRIHGPNFGVCGGPNSALECILTAATMLADPSFPGLWVVLTGHEPECLPGATPSASCIAVAMALKPAAASSIFQLEIGLAEEPGVIGHLPELQLPSIASALESPRSTAETMWRIGDSHWIKLESAVPGEEAAP